MKSDALDPLIDHLHSQSKLRVWSVIVTILGDVALPHGNQISGADLLLITNGLRIDERAVRTALTRLRQDGWIVSTRQGRSSIYSTAPHRLPDIESASRGIYELPAKASPDTWTLVSFPPGTQPKDCLYELPGRLCLCPAGDPVVDNALALEGRLRRVPDWVKHHICPTGISDKFQMFTARYEPILNQTKSLSGEQSLLLRTLLIHDWRKLVLRHPQVPDDLAPDGWSEPKAREVAARLYQSVSAISETAFDPTLAARAAPILATRFQAEGPANAPI